MRIKFNHVTLIFYLCMMPLVLTPAAAYAQKEFVIKSANTQLDESVYFLNAVFEINLPAYISEAFEQGFALPLAMQVEVFRERGFWLDKSVVTIKQQYRIQYHAMLDTVSLFNVNSGHRLHFSSLDEALNYLTVLLNYPLLDNNLLDSNERYNARLHFGVDHIELPIPLKSSSLWKNDWSIVSEWFKWDVKQ